MVKTTLELCVCDQVKTHLQSQAVKEIAVGFQHPHCSMSQGLRAIYSEHGMLGLWRGVSGAAPRVTVGSAAQLSSFSASKEFVVKCKVRIKRGDLGGLWLLILI